MLWLAIYLYVTATWAIWDTYVSNDADDIEWITVVVIVLWPLAFPLGIVIELTLLMGDALRRRFG